MSRFHFFRHALIVIAIVVLLVNWFSLRNEVKALRLDHARLLAITNIVLAIQDYYFLEDSFPETLSDLKSKSYLSSDAPLEDPETQISFYYLARSEDFVLCAWLSTGVRGVNSKECPVSSALPESEALNATRTLKIVEAGVNVRQEPRLNAKVIAGVNKDRIFPFVAKEDNWYKIVIEPGFEGWVSGDFVTISP